MVALAVGLGLARYVAHQITTPMEALVTYAGNTQGEAPPEVTGLSETDALATALRRYVETSEKAERELVALNTTLEQRIAAAVAERDDAAGAPARIRRRWRRSASSPAASPTTSTTC